MKYNVPEDERVSIQQLVIADMQEREAHGIREYGQPLYVDSPNDADGDPIEQAYKEVLDLCVYLRWEIERRHKAAAQRLVNETTGPHRIHLSN